MKMLPKKIDAKVIIHTNEKTIEFKIADRWKLNNEAIPAAEQMIIDGLANYAEVVYSNGWKESIGG